MEPLCLKQSVVFGQAVRGKWTEFIISPSKNTLVVCRFLVTNINGQGQQQCLSLLFLFFFTRIVIRCLSFLFPNFFLCFKFGKIVAEIRQRTKQEHIQSTYTRGNVLQMFSLFNQKQKTQNGHKDLKKLFFDTRLTHFSHNVRLQPLVYVY